MTPQKNDFCDDRLNDYTRKDYVDAKCQGIENTFNTAVQGIQNDVKTARESMDKRLEGMNEFRNQLKDQTAAFVTRSEFSQLKETTATFVTHAEYKEPHHRLEEEIKQLQLNRASLEGKASHNSVLVAYVFNVIAMLTAFAALAATMFMALKK